MKARKSFTRSKLNKDASNIYTAIQAARTVYIFGNGGSCSIANHMQADWLKVSNGGINIVSLCSNPSTLTMIGNDYGFEGICSIQLSWYAGYGKTEGCDALILISSSGNSPNIVKAAETAKHLGLTVVGLTGFDGGKLKGLCDVSIHINSTDYEEAEDYHQTVLHQVSRLIRADV